MKNYPHLKEMGIQNPQEIEKFAVYSTEDQDILRIVYKRKKGSPLPISKKFKFPRLKKSVIVDSGSRQTGMIFESVPAFRDALHELEQLKVEKTRSDDLAGQIADEINFLEEDVALRIAYIRALVKKL